MLKNSIHPNFLELFYAEIKDLELENSNKLNLFTLKVVNNSFAYNDLIELLGNNIYHFALSRTEVQELKEQDKLNTLLRKAKDKLRVYVEKQKEDAASGQNEGGELGELLLYCFLECHLNAPKILTKLEIKTANQMYVNGADGVHLLKITDKDYQLIFGESKLNSDLSQGIYKAFDSISKLLIERQGKLNFEIDLVNSQLVKETFNDEAYEFLKNVIVPKANEDVSNIDYSFGIFLGFNIDISEEELKKPNSEFRVHIRERIKKEIESKIESINFQIKKKHFTGYNFYVYVIPFSNLEKIRIEIINELAK